MKLIKNLFVGIICLLSLSTNAAGVKQRPAPKVGAVAPLAPLSPLDQFTSVNELIKFKFALQAKRSELPSAQQKQLDAQIAHVDAEITKRREAVIAPKKHAAKAEVPKKEAVPSVAKPKPAPASKPAQKGIAPKVAVAQSKPEKNIPQHREQAIEQANEEIASVEVKREPLEQQVKEQMLEELQKAFPDENARELFKTMSAQLEDEMMLKMAELIDLLGEEKDVISKVRELIKKKQAYQQMYRKMMFQVFDSLINKIRPIKNTFFQNYPGTQVEKEEAWKKVVEPISSSLED